jgi:hypothetical protein
MLNVSIPQISRTWSNSANFPEGSTTVQYLELPFDCMLYRLYRRSYKSIR